MRHGQMLEEKKDSGCSVCQHKSGNQEVFRDFFAGRHLTDQGRYPVQADNDKHKPHVVVTPQKLIEESPLALAGHETVKGTIEGGPEHKTGDNPENAFPIQLTNGLISLFPKEKSPADHVKDRNVPAAQAGNQIHHGPFAGMHIHFQIALRGDVDENNGKDGKNSQQIQMPLSVGTGFDFRLTRCCSPQLQFNGC